MTDVRVAIAATDIDWLIALAEERLDLAKADGDMGVSSATARLDAIKAGGAAPVLADIVTVTVVHQFGDDKSGLSSIVGVWRSERDAALVLTGVKAALAEGRAETVAVQ